MQWLPGKKKLEVVRKPVRVCIALRCLGALSQSAQDNGIQIASKLARTVCMSS